MEIVPEPHQTAHTEQKIEIHGMMQFLMQIAETPEDGFQRADGLACSRDPRSREVFRMLSSGSERKDLWRESDRVQLIPHHRYMVGGRSRRELECMSEQTAVLLRSEQGFQLWLQRMSRESHPEFRIPRQFTLESIQLRRRETAQGREGISGLSDSEQDPVCLASLDDCGHCVQVREETEITHCLQTELFIDTWTAWEIQDDPSMEG